MRSERLGETSIWTTSIAVALYGVVIVLVGRHYEFLLCGPR